MKEIFGFLQYGLYFIEEDGRKYYLADGNTFKMKEIYKFLDKHKILSMNGKAMMKHISKDTFISSNELTERGFDFMTKYYDKVQGFDYKTIRQELEKEWDQFNNN
jgi:hypothetical protein